MNITLYALKNGATCHIATFSQKTGNDANRRPRKRVTELKIIAEAEFAGVGACPFTPAADDSGVAADDSGVADCGESAATVKQKILY